MKYYLIGGAIALMMLLTNPTQKDLRTRLGLTPSHKSYRLSRELNFFVFSVWEVRRNDVRGRVLGVFGNFIPLGGDMEKLQKPPKRKTIEELRKEMDEEWGRN